MPESTTTDDRIDALDEQIAALDGIDSLADTPFSALFHEARTARSRFTGATVQVRVRDGEVETSDPVLTRQGEHLRGTAGYDGRLSLPAQSFMDVRTASADLRRQLRKLKRFYSQQDGGA